MYVAGRQRRTLQTNMFRTADYLVYVSLNMYVLYCIRNGKSGILKGIPFNYPEYHSHTFLVAVLDIGIICVWQCKECYINFVLSVTLAMRENRPL